MKIKTLPTLILLLTATLGLHAQSGKAKALLDQVYDKVTGYDNILVDFKVVLENERADRKSETRGDVTLQGDKYLVNVFGNRQLYDGKKVYTIVPDDEEVTVEDHSEDEDAITPQKMLTFYRTGHDYTWDIEQSVNGRKIQYVKLTPKDPRSELKSALLGIDVQTKHIYKVVENGKNGAKTTITVLSMKVDQPLARNLFTFDEAKYKQDGYQIVNW